jgi:pantothenate kinase
MISKVSRNVEEKLNLESLSAICTIEHSKTLIWKTKTLISAILGGFKFYALLVKSVCIKVIE